MKALAQEPVKIHKLREEVLRGVYVNAALTALVLPTGAMEGAFRRDLTALYEKYEGGKGLPACSECGTPLSERTDRYCMGCGASVAHLHNTFCGCGFSAAEDPHPEEKKPFCPLCGGKVTPERPASAPTPDLSAPVWHEALRVGIRNTLAREVARHAPSINPWSDSDRLTIRACVGVDVEESLYGSDWWALVDDCVKGRM